MKLSEKLQVMRKKTGYSQEYLADLCNVSRQCISKWEADIAMPSTDKLLLLSKEKQEACEECTKMGIPCDQMHWAE